MPIVVDDQGLIELTVNAEGASTTVKLDLYECHCVVMDAWDNAQKENAGRATWLCAVRDWLAQKGFAAVSLYVVDRFSDAVVKAVEALKKNDGGERTAPLPGTSEPASSLLQGATA